MNKRINRIRDACDFVGDDFCEETLDEEGYNEDEEREGRYFDEEEI